MRCLGLEGCDFLGKSQHRKKTRHQTLLTIIPSFDPVLQLTYQQYLINKTENKGFDNIFSD